MKTKQDHCRSRTESNKLTRSQTRTSDKTFTMNYKDENGNRKRNETLYYVTKLVNF